MTFTDNNNMQNISIWTLTSHTHKYGKDYNIYFKNNDGSKGRQIFELNRNEGLTYLEISEYLDISVKTVETHMRRAFQKLRESLKKYILLFVIGSAAIWNLSRVFM